MLDQLDTIFKQLKNLRISLMKMQMKLMLLYL